MTLETVKKKPLSTLLDELYLEVPDVPTFLARPRLERAAIEFCADSLYWREQVNTVEVVTAGQAVSLLMPSGAVSAGLVQCYGTDGEPVAANLFDVNADASSIEFDRPLGEVVIVAALIPKNIESKVPETLLQKYGSGLVSGAAAKLVRMPNQPWSNPPMMAYFQKLFSNAVSEAKRDALEGYRPHDARERLVRKGVYY